MNKLNPNVGDQVIAHDTFNIINQCVGTVHAIRNTFPTKKDFESNTNQQTVYVCEFDRGTFILNKNQIKEIL